MIVTQDAGYLCSASYNLAVYLTAFGTSSGCPGAPPGERDAIGLEELLEEVEPRLFSCVPTTRGC